MSDALPLTIAAHELLVCCHTTNVHRRGPSKRLGNTKLITDPRHESIHGLTLVQGRLTQGRFSQAQARDPGWSPRTDLLISSIVDHVTRGCLESSFSKSERRFSQHDSRNSAHCPLQCPSCTLCQASKAQRF